ncbi:MAG TPA: flavodoxin [bacterium]|nr:flavodoxin [bacterium]HPS28794.1 flavodoxin [bacterium]
MWLLTLFSVVNALGDITIQENAPADQEKSSPKILVVYYSNSGITEKVGGLLAVALEADQEKLIDKKDRKGIWNYLVAAKDAIMKNETEIDTPAHDPSKYDLIIIGTPIWAAKMTPAVRTYINKYKSKFKKVAFFTTSGGTTFDKTIPEMEEISGKKAVLKNGFFEKEVKNDSPEMIKKLNEYMDSVKKIFLDKI